MVPFLDLKAGYMELKPELDAAYHRVMDSGWYLMGQELSAFETEFATSCTAKYALGVGNGLDALHIILRAYGIGPGDEVIVPAHTFIATWLAVSYAGATPVPVDVDPVYYGIDPSLIESAITPRTKAIMPVHLYGHPAAMDPILGIAKKHGLKVIEDAAQAHNASYRGRICGALGDAAAFSFYPGKNLGAFSDAGAVVTQDRDVSDQVKKLRNYGSEVKYQHDIPGVNSRMDELSAATLCIKLRHMSDWHVRRCGIADFYRDALEGVPEIILPTCMSDAVHAWHLFVIRHPERDRLQESLSSAGVSTLIHYPTPPYLTKAYESLGYSSGAFPVTEQLCSEILSLPIGPHLDCDNATYVAEQIRRAL